MDQQTPEALIFVETGRGEFGMRPLLEAKRLGLTTLLLARTPEIYLSSERDRELCERAVDEMVPVDTRRLEEVVESLSARADSFRYVGVFSALDYFMPMAARAAEALGLPGATPAAVESARDKAAMRKVTHGAGVPTPTHRYVSSTDELLTAVEEIGLPVIVKPPTDAAGIGVQLCIDASAAAAHFADLRSRPSNMRGQDTDGGVLVEQYLIGMDIGIDMIDTGSERVLLGLTDEYSTGSPLYIENGETFPSVLPSSVRDACVEVANAALDALGFHFGASHVEVKVTNDGPFLIEVNPRMGGGGIPEMIELSTGINAVRELLRLHVGWIPDLRHRHSRAAASKSVIAHAAGTFIGFEGLERAALHPGFHSFVPFASPGAEIAEAVDDRADLGYAIYVGETPGEAERRASAGIGEIAASIR
ncbi:ATP-grasp domain-containing protein [Microbacterium lacticum]|uniref:ATP-grasp domain-containing protein n=1 Tax=Microbacterium lacticum TaxID=33885 RepID=UPI0018B03DF9|nr:ATP-grasp domain-containing protein [Microbacterium lacticum]MBF9336461.1 ATP-grasp domain-containing protein [Microbacterium lacticum]